MPALTFRHLVRSISLPGAIVAGLSGGAAYLVIQAIDMPLLKEPTNDLKLLGMVVTRRSPWWQIFGLAGHFGFSIVLAVLYAATLDRWLRWPAPLRGLTIALAENTILWFAFIRLIDRWHPAIKQGELPTYNRLLPFVQQVLRHIAYGVALGATYGDRKERQ